MGFLRINGRQMFALAQVFSDLFKDIPRTTVNKRMEVLNIRSRRCDIQELRTLKAIHSVPVRAVKCSLITKEDLEALCVACQSLSPKKRRKKRKCKKTETENDISPDALCTRICKKKHSVAKTLLAKDTAGLTVAGAAQRARRLLQVPHSKPAQNFSKSKNTRSSLLLGPVRKDLRNYEKVAKGRNCYSLKGVNGILPQAFVGTYPNKTLHSAIATNDCSKTSLPLCLKGKDPCYSRYEEYSNGCVKKHNSPALLVGNKTLNFASKKGNIGAVSAGGLKKAHCTQGTSAGYSSDSESSLDFEKDSDFGSSFQSTSTDSSDEDGRSALSSSSEEGSSSESDSSSVCSGDSVQSTRYRQAALPTPISRFPLPSGRDAARLPEEAAVATCKIPAKRFTSTEPPLKIKTEPLCLDPGFLLLEQHGRRWATHTPTATTLKPPAFNCLKETIKTEPSWAVTTGSYNVTSLSIGDQAESQIKDLSSESAFQNAASCSSGAPIQTAVQNFTGTDRICIVADPAGDIKEQRKDKFERLIRTVFKSKVSKNHSGGAAAAAGGGGGGSFFKTFNSPKSKGRSTLSSKAFKVNGLERNLKRNQAPKRSDAERKQRCTKGTSKRGRKANISKRENAAKAGASFAAAASFCKRKASGGSTTSTPVKKPFSLLGSFPCPASLVVGKDGDLSPAYSLCSQKCLPHQKAHPPCRMWQLGGCATPVPPSHKFRSYNLEDD
ncbi:SKDA1 protein, partial [Polyodon spathula]|nr:SKDA1 protein [Polyodon spathula]